MTNIEKTLDQRASWLKQRSILQEQYKSAIVLAYNGSFFTAGPVLIATIQGLIEHGLESAVLIDDNNLPCKITDLKGFQKHVIEKNQLALNIFEQDYAQLKQQRTVA